MDQYPLNTKFLKRKIFNPKTLKNFEKLYEFSEKFSFSRFLILPQQTTESAACTMCPPMASSVNYNNFLQKWERNVVLQKSTVEISGVRSAILKECEVDVFESAHWSFNLEGPSDKLDVCTDLSEVHTGRYQRSVNFWELHTLHTDLWEVHTDSDIWEVRTGLWEVRTDVKKGRSDV